MSEQNKLTNEELHRYARHISLPSFGMEGQKRLKESSVLCIGAGGLGSPSTMYLAAAGVGRIGLMDMDEVDESNIQRQLLHGTGDVGRKKIESAKDTINNINLNNVRDNRGNGTWWQSTAKRDDNASGIVGGG